MADRFDEAPPLPREPTAISVPDAMGNPTPATDAPPDPTAISESLPPPPKFPSLTDVDIASARAAADAHGMPQQPPVDTSLVSSATTDTRAQTQPVEALSDPPASRPTSALHDDIEAAIQRASVTPGTGQRKVTEVGHRLWTSADQAELDRLLAEGQEVFVPPDVETDDLPHPRSSPYFYVPIPSAGGVDTAPDTRSMADRIAIWNQVVTEDPQGSRAAAGAGAAAVAGAATAAGIAAAGETAELTPAEQVEDVQEASPVGDTTRDTATAERGTEGLEAPAETTTEKAVPTVRSNADVAQSIFGGKFLTVPVKSQHVVNGETTLIGETGDDDEAKTTEVMLRSDASASINIKDDYGLKDGHTVGCNDAVFLDENKTLVTCGDDGRVCIWDMKDRTVSKEFVPYEGEPVIMIYPMTDDDDGQSHTLMTLSKSRLMRIWTVDDKQAVMLRSTQIQSSEKDLYMSVPVISKELKIRAAAAAAAAAVRTTDAPEAAVAVGTAQPEAAPTPVAPAAETAAAAVAAPAPKPEQKEEEKERKRFSFTKVLSFGRSSSRKAVPS